MSIAEQESAQKYPDQYWPGFEPREGYLGKLAYLTGMTTDDLREAYESGRTAPVTDVEIDAGAKVFYDRCVPNDGEPRWDEVPDAIRVQFRDHAKLILTAARKAVSDE